MKRGKAFLVVGHKQWGKSRTLKALTDDSHYARTVTIANRELFIRRMSNDDNQLDFSKLIRKLRPARHPYVILAFCPVFERNAADLLRVLNKNYDIHSFVLRHAFGGDRCISEKEFAALEEFGRVEDFKCQAEPSDRAKALRDFIEQSLRKKDGSLLTEIVN